MPIWLLSVALRGKSMIGGALRLALASGTMTVNVTTTSLLG